MSVADAIAPPDFALNSIIGKSDGMVWLLHYVPHEFAFIFIILQLYQNLQHEFMTNPGAMERASWWQDVVLPKSKL